MNHRKCRNIDHQFFLSHPDLKKHTALLKFIKKSFRPEDDIWFIKAPGRVNLIGEHTDYNMGPVLPCAIDREIVFCLRKNSSGTINVSNIIPSYENIHFSLGQPIRPYPMGNWGNYIKAGINGLLDYYQQSENEKFGFSGYDAIVSSNLPVAAGISSSSALVVVSALSLLRVNQIALNNLKLAEICAEAEHFVGTAGGGMDQAASLMGKKDSFLKIEFNPLQVQTVPAPKEILLILFHSLIQAEKSHSVRKEYNRRVFECQISVELFNTFISDKFEQNPKPIRFIGEIKSENLELSDIELHRVTSEFLCQLKPSYTMEELAALLDISAEDLRDKYQKILKDEHAAEPQDGFKIKGRFQHVYTECRRVDEMIRCLKNNDIAGMGLLLNASHQSLVQNYEVSTNEVNALIKRLRSFNVWGARLMGAGFGGMILALTDLDHAEALINSMKKTFYQHKVHGKIDDFIIPCVTSDGAESI